MLEKYNCSAPFEHLVLDDFLSDDLITRINNEFWDISDARWTTYGVPFYNENSQKLQMYDLEKMPESIQDFYSICTADEFLKKMSKLSGIKIEKYSLFGAGMNVYGKAAALKAHTDFNFNDDIKAYRCLNLLLYLNKEWDTSHGGCLQLWSPDLKESLDIAPVSNRLVIFPTNNSTPHGVSEVSSGVQRRSLSLYYYSVDPPKGVSETPHRTVWK